jgi:flagellin
MGLRINSNIEAFNAHRNLQLTSVALSKSMQRLSSGLRINSAADDAAGLGISERMKAQISGVQQASRNAQDGISMVQTAEGSMQEISSILQRVRDLAVQYNNGTYSTADRAAITAEVSQLDAEITRIIGSSNFNGIPLLGSATTLATLQVGPNSTASDQVAVAGVDAATSVGTAVSNFGTNGVASLTAIDAAISNIAANRGSLGAVQNRLEHTVNSLSAYEENLMAAQSRIADVDMAEELTNLTRLQILQQSGTAMLAQANQIPSSILSLLQ